MTEKIKKQLAEYSVLWTAIGTLSIFCLMLAFVLGNSVKEYANFRDDFKRYSNTVNRNELAVSKIKTRIDEMEEWVITHKVLYEIDFDDD